MERDIPLASRAEIAKRIKTETMRISTIVVVQDFASFSIFWDVATASSFHFSTSTPMPIQPNPPGFG